MIQDTIPKTHSRCPTGKSGKSAVKKRLALVTVEENVRERRLVTLSRTAAWRVGCFLEDMDRDVKVFLEKGKGKKRERRSSFEEDDKCSGPRRKITMPGGAG